MTKRTSVAAVTLGLLAGLCLDSSLPAQAPPQGVKQGGSQVQPAAVQTGQAAQQQPGGRRTQRVRMEEVRVASPDGNVVFTLLANAERLSYTVTLDNTTVIEPSALSLSVDGFDLASGVIFGSATRNEVNESFPWHGAHASATHHSIGARVQLTHDLSFTPYMVEVRAFNDGVAYRWVVPGEDSVKRVPDEYSNFVLPAGTRVWFHDLDGHYEAAYLDREVSEVTAGQWAAPPVTSKLPGNAGYVSITEANLANYSGMALEADGRRGWIVGLGHRHPINYPYELRYGREEAKRLGTPAAVTGTITTPWRVVKVARDLNALVNSDIVPSLSPPADPKLFPRGIETPWVEPGLAVWDYVDRDYEKSEASPFDRMKAFSRMAGQIGARYHILEGFAYGWTDDQVREFVEYSKQQGVRVLFWRHSRDLRTPETREEFFSRLHRLGVAGAKIDFFDHEAREVVDLYEVLLAKAAQYQCVVDFHGANKPTGRMRTWPNDMIREAVRGMESRSLRERARHETILPFARYLAGPADYTTMHFGARRGDTTWAHQIASLATFDSPILTIAAHPQSVLDNPALDVIKSIRAVWDETIVLPESSIGELSIFARRDGVTWMLAVMCGPQARTIKVPLSFLGEGTYKASYVRDDKTRDDAEVVEQGTARRTDTLTIEMRSGGGFVGRFVR